MGTGHRGATLVTVLFAVASYNCYEQLWHWLLERRYLSVAEYVRGSAATRAAPAAANVAYALSGLRSVAMMFVLNGLSDSVMSAFIQRTSTKASGRMT